MNNRRKLIVALGAGALTAPITSFAQQPDKVWRVGFLTLGSQKDSEGSIAAFSRGLHELGYVEGKNIVIEYRFAEGNYDRLPELGAEMVRLRVDAIVGISPQAISAAQKATSTIPIIMGSMIDPVGSGFVKSLSRPGGNITGLSNLMGDLGPKLLQLLLNTVPKISRVAVLMNPTNSGHANIVKTVEAAARKRGVKVLQVQAKTTEEIANAFSVMARQKSEAVIIMSDNFFTLNRTRIAELALIHRLPSVSSFARFSEAGVLMSYGADLFDNYRRAATYVDKIFKGAKPGDLPVEQPTKFDLVVNTKTAKMLGITIPSEVMLQVTRVID